MAHAKLVPTLTIALALLLPPAASATVRYAAPNAYKSSGGCPAATPCTAEWAIEGATEGDEVVITPGTYNVTSSIFSPVNLSIHGVKGEPRPRLVAADNLNSQVLSVGSPAGLSTLEHVTVEDSRDGYTALYTYAKVAISDVVAIARGASGVALGTSDSGTALIRDTLVRSTKGGTAIYAKGKVDLRNVTAIGQGANSVALRAEGVCWPTPYCDIDRPATVSVVNTIARGVGHDVHATSHYEDTPAKVSLSHSNWRPDRSVSDGDWATIADLGSNQSAAPAFRLAIWGDYHQASTSPTIDAGTTTPENGPVDFDGQPRLGGAAVDIGADEYHDPATSGGGEMPSGDDPGSGETPPTDPGTGGPGPAAGPSTPPDTTAPTIAKLAAKPRRFRPAKTGLSTAAKGGAKTTYTLDEPASVTFAVQRAAAGRVAKGSCVKPSKSNATARRCTRWVLMKGTFQHAGGPGKNSFRFTGRIEGRALRPGRYRLFAAPSDSSGNTGSPATAPFEIAR